MEMLVKVTRTILDEHVVYSFYFHAEINTTCFDVYCANHSGLLFSKLVPLYEVFSSFSLRHG